MYEVRCWSWTSLKLSLGLFSREREMNTEQTLWASNNLVMAGFNRLMAFMLILMLMLWREKTLLTSQFVDLYERPQRSRRDCPGLPGRPRRSPCPGWRRGPGCRAGPGWDPAPPPPTLWRGSTADRLTAFTTTTDVGSHYSPLRVSCSQVWWGKPGLMWEQHWHVGWGPGLHSSPLRAKNTNSELELS